MLRITATTEGGTTLEWSLIADDEDEDNILTAIDYATGVDSTVI